MRSDQRFPSRMISPRPPHPACGGFFLLVDSLGIREWRDTDPVMGSAFPLS